MVADFRVGIPYDGVEATFMVERVKELTKVLDDAAAGVGCDITWDGVKVVYRDPIDLR